MRRLREISRKKREWKKGEGLKANWMDGVGLGLGLGFAFISMGELCKSMDFITPFPRSRLPVNLPSQTILSFPLQKENNKRKIQVDRNRILYTRKLSYVARIGTSAIIT